MRILFAALVAALFISAGSVAGAQSLSFAIIPGVALGPIQLDMSFERAKLAMPNRPTRIETKETRDIETGVVATKAVLIWDRIKERGEGSLNVFLAADFSNGRMLSAWGDDDRLAYRGKNIADLRLTDLFAALGVPDGVRATSPYSYVVVWNEKGILAAFEVAGSFQDALPQMKVGLIGVFRPGRFADYVRGD